MNRGDDVGARDVENLVAAFELLVVVEAGVVLLQHRSHGAIGDDDPLVECVKKRLRASGSIHLFILIAACAGLRRIHLSTGQLFRITINT